MGRLTLNVLLSFAHFCAKTKSQYMVQSRYTGKATTRKDLLLAFAVVRDEPSVMGSHLESPGCASSGLY
jgi:hypothetical protein